MIQSSKRVIFHHQPHQQMDWKNNFYFYGRTEPDNNNNNTAYFTRVNTNCVLDFAPKIFINRKFSFFVIIEIVPFIFISILTSDQWEVQKKKGPKNRPNEFDLKKKRNWNCRAHTYREIGRTKPVRIANMGKFSISVIFNLPINANCHSKSSYFWEFRSLAIFFLVFYFLFCVFFFFFFFFSFFSTIR